jgi:hypothetical protein
MIWVNKTVFIREENTILCLLYHPETCRNSRQKKVLDLNKTQTQNRFEWAMNYSVQKLLVFHIREGSDFVTGYLQLLLVFLPMWRSIKCLLFEGLNCIWLSCLEGFRFVFRMNSEPWLVNSWRAAAISTGIKDSDYISCFCTAFLLSPVI